MTHPHITSAAAATMAAAADHPRFTVASSECSAVWTFTAALSGPHAARLYYAEVNRVPLESVSVGRREVQS